MKTRRAKPHSSRKRKEAPITFTRADSITLWAIIVGIAAAVFAIIHVAATAQQQSALNDLVHRRWRHEYHLNDEQARRIRAMEEDFHGSGNPFFRPAHTPGETRDHHRAMALEMSPEDGERFFRAQEGAPLHSKPLVLP